MARIVELEISLNGGVDWDTAQVGGPSKTLYTSLDAPSIAQMSHHWSGLGGGFDLTLKVEHLRYREGCTMPAKELPEGEACARAADLSHCRIGLSETPLVHLSATHAKCRVPA
jgi:hypothetical protein